jgi:predicted enzyme related to lactoylglutathione lyase
MATRRMVAVIVEVADLERSTALYRDGFGIDLHRGDNGVEDPWIGGLHAEISWTEGAYLHFALYQSKAAVTSRVQLAFEVDDAEAALRTAESHGATVLHEPRTEPWGTSARVLDYDGNVIELTQRSG